MSKPLLLAAELSLLVYWPLGCVADRDAECSNHPSNVQETANSAVETRAHFDAATKVADSQQIEVEKKEAEITEDTDQAQKAKAERDRREVLEWLDMRFAPTVPQTKTAFWDIYRLSARPPRCIQSIDYDDKHPVIKDFVSEWLPIEEANELLSRCEIVRHGTFCYTEPRIAEGNRFACRGDSRLLQCILHLRSGNPEAVFEISFEKRNGRIHLDSIDCFLAG